MHLTTVQSPENVLVLYFFHFFIDSAFTAVEKDAKKFCTKGICEKRYHLSIGTHEKGEFSVNGQKWFIKGYGVRPRGGAYQYKTLLSTPPPLRFWYFNNAITALAYATDET